MVCLEADSGFNAPRGDYHPSSTSQYVMQGKPQISRGGSGRPNGAFEPPRAPCCRPMFTPVSRRIHIGPPTPLPNVPLLVGFGVPVLETFPRLQIGGLW